MLKFSEKKLVIKGSIGSEALLEVFNESDREVLFIAKPSIPNCLRICGKDKLREWIASKEKLTIVVKCIDEIQDRGDSFYIRFEEILRKASQKIYIQVEADDTDRALLQYQRKQTMSEPDCNICYEPFDSTNRIPRIIKQCGHTICQNCIENLLKQNDNKFIICPQDKKKTTVENGIESFPKNFSLLELIDEAKSPDSFVRTEKPKITETQQTKPEERKKTEHNVSESKRITVVKKEELEETDDNVKHYVTDKKCPNHSHEKGRFLCTSSECKIETKLMCPECMTEDGTHEGHSYVSSKHFFEKREKVEVQLDKICSTKTDLEKRLKDCKQTIEKLKNEYAVVEKETMQIYLELHEEKNNALGIKELERGLKRDGEKEKMEEALFHLESDKETFTFVHQEISSLFNKKIIDKKVMEALEKAVEIIPNKYGILKFMSGALKNNGKNYYNDVKCSTHSQELVKFYCTDPNCSSKDKLMCVECMSDNGEHEEHLYGSLKKLNENKGRIAMVKEKIEELKENVSDEIAKLKKRMAQRDKEFLEEMRVMKEKHSQELKLIEVKKRKATEMIMKHQEKNLKLVDGQREQIESSLEKIEKFRMAAEKILDNLKFDNQFLKALDQFNFPVIENENTYEFIPPQCAMVYLDDEWNLQLDS